VATRECALSFARRSRRACDCKKKPKERPSRS
jgi:hypothetical protein